MQCIISKNDKELSFDEFYSLESECFPSEPFNEIQYSDTIQDDFWTARVEGNLAGFVCIISHQDRVHLSRLEVHSQYRRAGIGALLIDKVIEFTALKNLPSVSLTVRTNNIPAYNLYVKKGFSIYGYKNRYAIPIQNLSETSPVDLIQTGEGKNCPVSFVEGAGEIGTGKFNYQIGGCKDFALTNPDTNILSVLAAIKAKVKPGSANVYVMTENPETIKALKALSFATETEMADMIYDTLPNIEKGKSV